MAVLTGVRLRVHSGSVCTLECALDTVAVIRDDCVQCGAHMWPSRSSGFTGVRPWSRRVHPSSPGSLECALGVAGLI